MIKLRQRLIATVGTLLIAGTIGGASMALAHSTPAPPSPTTAEQCDTAEPGGTPDQPGAPDTVGGQDGDQGGPEVPDVPCG
ncbi:hypothetical protein [Mycolicibacterium sp. YH-1]|uniref:hypothetical protein n=1 Tax=Mycolicibacterium sp. YH-1 TaxID=2908837 RepID=UPI001F4BF22F|nr:hypothetical protein [Mycolicibacterium sp. YH-1]UNB49837.1 hypothetical protein L0M16_17610 [Mycolicibacterium sp. YH-1]